MEPYNEVMSLSCHGCVLRYALLFSIEETIHKIHMARNQSYLGDYHDWE